MHKAIRKEMKKFRERYSELLVSAKIAELGALNMNGSPKDCLPNGVIGFDLVDALLKLAQSAFEFPLVLLVAPMVC